MYYFIRRIFMVINDILDKNRVSFEEIAKKSGISRTTLFTIRQNPERAKLSTLRAIAAALGYRMVVSLEKEKNDAN